MLRDFGYPQLAQEEGQRVTRLSSKRSNSLREGSREPNSDNGIMLLIHNLYLGLPDSLAAAANSDQVKALV